MSELQDRLVKFAGEFLSQYPDVPKLDRYDVVGVAETCGLIQKKIVNQPCGDVCACADVHTKRQFRWGVTNQGLWEAMQSLRSSEE